MSRIQQFRGQIQRIHIVALVTALIISSVFLVLLAPMTHADPVAAPILNPAITSGEYRNTFTTDVTATSNSLVQVTIEVKYPDGNSLSPRVFAEGVAGQATVALRWDTTTENDGAYRIFYTATDTNGQTTQESYPISINNSQPTLSLNSTASERTIGGGISLATASFIVKIDGVVRPIQPSIAQVPGSNGNYAWTLVVPTDVTEGSHTFDITATSFFSGKSANAIGTLQITSAQATTTDSNGQSGALTLDDPAKEVGQFVAPPMPSSGQTQLFGVSTTDLTKKQPDTLGVVSAPQQTTPLLVKRGAIAADAVPIAPSKSGWIIFGIAWYWWLGVVIIVSGGVYGIVRYARVPFRRSLIIGAESQ